jgi:Fe-S-cluster containining protein
MDAHFAFLPGALTPGSPAGSFSDWLAVMDSALAGTAVSDVPCGDCTACCRGAYFIHIEPNETDTLAAIPVGLAVPAPGGGAGHRLLGFDQRGRCPMLAAGSCSIYAQRPATCARYDCRIFAATGLAEGGPEKAEIMQRARRWAFSYRDSQERSRHEALKAGARLLVASREALGDLLPATATQLAMLVIRLHPVLFELAAAQDGELPNGAAVVERLGSAIQSLRERAVDGV